MLSLDYLTAEELKEFISDRSKSRNNSDSSDFDEIRDFFRISSSDNFLLIRYDGDIEKLSSRLNFVKFPKRCFRMDFILNGNFSTQITDTTDVHDAFLSRFDYENDYIQEIALDGSGDMTEVIFITKIFAQADLGKRDVFRSLWDCVTEDLNVSNDESFYNSLKTLECDIYEDIIYLDMTGMTRSRFLMSLKTAEAEKYIEEYTGKKYFIRIK